MLKTIASALLLAAVLGGAAGAAGVVELTDANNAKIREMLIEQGYEVAKIKLEDGMYEAYAKKDGQRFEVFLNGDFEIVKVENDD